MKFSTTAAALLLLPPSLLLHSLAYTALSESSLKLLPSPGSDFDIHTGSLLAPILRVRVPGTAGNTAVLHHFVDFFRQSLPAWRIEFQNSTSTTPTSPKTGIPFRNLIVTRDPPWTQGDGDVRRLALVAHYDSKLTPDGFIGATDSAAPCAMLLHAARSIDAALTAKWEKMAADGDHLDVEANTGVQILLLDGEEAFQSWTATDSLYGARSLAEEWEGTAYGAWSAYRNPLASLDLFVLLDLLGAEAPRVPSYFKTTHWAYQLMANVESRLRDAGMFKSSPNHRSKKPRRDGKKRKEPMFLHQAAKKEDERWPGGSVEDDHVPFMARGVEVLHLIPSPFPDVWHTMEDDGEHLHGDTVEDWALLTVAFAAEWLDLEGFLPEIKEGEGKREGEGKMEIGKREEEKSELYP